MKIQTIASGSKANCSIILCRDTNLIIDIGVPYLTLKRNLEKISLSPDMFDGILITHCHSDHIKGLSSLLKHTNINVYIPEEMYDSLKESLPRGRCIFIDDVFKINDVKVELIHTSHDAPCSVGFIITHDDKSIVYITDTGYINRKYLKKITSKDMYIIESNHDEVMLMDGPYPRFLKERIISDSGHLSNKTSAKYLKKVIGPNTKNIILIHLSEKNNTEELALNSMREEITDENIKIVIAKQSEAGPLIEV